MEYPLPAFLNLTEEDAKRRMDMISHEAPSDMPVKKYAAARLKEEFPGSEWDFLNYCMLYFRGNMNSMISSYGTQTFSDGNGLVNRLREFYLLKRLEFESQ